MDLPSEAPIVRTDAGAMEGAVRQQVSAFRAIPYAAAPVGPLRFLPPQAVEPWSGVRSAKEQALAIPQPPSRADDFMGPLPVPGYDENALTLNVWSPASGSDERLPVMVWFHGGGFMFGSGAASHFDGAALARRGRMVVVTVNYRLGVLGYLYFPPGWLGPEAVANVGLQDQCEALNWVRRNIAAFGGDPDNVTVAGQSAGALSIVGLAAMPRAKGLFHRAILHSASINVDANKVEDAERLTRSFFDAAGLAAEDVEALRALPVSALHAAQGQVLLQLVGALGCDPRLKPAGLAPFQLVVDGQILPENPADAARNGSMDHLDVLMLGTSEEMRFAYAYDPTFWKRDRTSIVTEVEQVLGSEGRNAFERYERRWPDKSAPDVLCDMLSEEGFAPAIELAERLAAQGHPAYLAWFNWRSPAAEGRLGAAHTVELPFLFNNFEHWSSAPMIAEADKSTLQPLGDRLQDAWAAFCATGQPGPDWPPYAPPDRHAMEFGPTIQMISNPAPDRTSKGLTFRR